MLLGHGFTHTWSGSCFCLSLPPPEHCSNIRYKIICGGECVYLFALCLHAVEQFTHSPVSASKPSFAPFCRFFQQVAKQQQGRNGKLGGGERGGGGSQGSQGDFNSQMHRTTEVKQ